ncbi:enoyl-CoA hydratase/isomerase family protein [Mycolicibacterium tokaiense]|uniref:Enoyl-CoA hydratase/isomerase n=1 Tax=Mycolicibacterium tokaiense TaxID=39695 RepID=A0A378TGG3_9MYCO|nr:enoyl-CoA hydratase/isomerase family protein [Mycolicibacterium tokaiense]BBY86602.1 3-hydroxybutyryl-CoA dehydratase [Mycolicibacterium tokaiense]STZ58893.1 enoyl-CoA hydratase/isomerase [Mycolicibacterium tokaiense]
MTDGAVRLEISGPVARIVLDRPRKRNALSAHLVAELGDRLEDIAGSDARVVLLTAEGSVFCAGADTVEFSAASAEAVRGRWTRLGQRVFRSLAELPQTTVAVLAGGAYGGGLELAMHCDFRVASDTAVLALPEATLGTTPGWSGLSRIREIAGVAAARRLALVGQPVSAAEGHRLGIVDIVTADVQSAADDLVQDLLNTAPGAQSILKRVLACDASALIDSLAGGYLVASGETNSRRHS